jgi:terminal uridylyltransferase
MASGNEGVQSLEDQLRDMILSNVTITEARSPRARAHHGPSREPSRANVTPSRHVNQRAQGPSKNPPRQTPVFPNAAQASLKRPGQTAPMAPRHGLQGIPNAVEKTIPMVLDAAQGVPPDSKQTPPMPWPPILEDDSQGPKQMRHQPHPLPPRPPFRPAYQPIFSNTSISTDSRYEHALPPPGIELQCYAPVHPTHRVHQMHNPGYGTAQDHGYRQSRYQELGQAPLQRHSFVSSDRQPYQPQHSNYQSQVDYLDQVVSEEVPTFEMPPAEKSANEAFRSYLETIFRQALEDDTISLVAFGSIVSGFATTGSDMDLAMISGSGNPKPVTNDLKVDPSMPQCLEEKLLGIGIGARLLTRTRVPILKICEKPTEGLLKALLDDKKKREEPKTSPSASARVEQDSQSTNGPLCSKHIPDPTHMTPHALGQAHETVEALGVESGSSRRLGPKRHRGLPHAASAVPPPGLVQLPTQRATQPAQNASNHVPEISKNSSNGDLKEHTQRVRKTWLREKALGPLDFPKSGVGIQCDVNFGNTLGIYNTRLLRCYSLCDERVRPIVLFVKGWAKRRRINSSYSGTLCSYGYVLMVLHYLVQVAHPPVCPNLQSLPRTQPRSEYGSGGTQQHDVRFWSNEQEIMNAALVGALTSNTQSVGELLRGFYFYYSGARDPLRPRQRYFNWNKDVVSLQHSGGGLTKEAKGWVSATNVQIDGKTVHNCNLLCIEDPFEKEHNVARTVRPRGFSAIRQEFRRVAQILNTVTEGNRPLTAALFDEVTGEGSVAGEQNVEKGAGDAVMAQQVSECSLRGVVKPAKQGNATFVE